MNSIERRIATNLERYGVSNVAKLPEVQAKRRKSFEDKKDIAIFYQDPRINILKADDLKVFRLAKDVADNWLNKYHPFKAPRGNVVCLGLTDGSEIYAIMTFKKSRNPEYFAELSRLWMLPTYQVISGYDMLSSAASDLGIYNIVAYVNMSFENYLDYESIGMRYIRDIQPTKWWIRDDDRISDASRRQKKLSENDLVFKGYVPIYDCGQRVYVFN